MTNRCPVERCNDRTCLGTRLCVEEVRPTSCPEGQPQSLCRQYIQARCVLPPHPTDCSQITCGPGMFCRERRRGEGVICAQARNCDHLACDDGTICTETEQGPLCVVSIALSCEELSCPGRTVCVSYSIPSRNISVAQCLDREEAEMLPTFDTFFCGSGATICEGQTTCIDIFDSGNYLVPGCITIGCDPESNSLCKSSRVCTKVPESVNAPFTTACLGSTSSLQNTTCLSAANDRCPSFLVCRETFFEGQFFFTTCGVPAPTFTAPSCAELECPEPLACNELGIVEERGGVARCAGPEFTGDTEQMIRSLLDVIDD